MQDQYKNIVRLYQDDSGECQTDFGHTVTCIRLSAWVSITNGLKSGTRQLTFSPQQTLSDISDLFPQLVTTATWKNRAGLKKSLTCQLHRMRYTRAAIFHDWLCHSMFANCNMVYRLQCCEAVWAAVWRDNVSWGWYVPSYLLSSNSASLQVHSVLYCSCAYVTSCYFGVRR